MQPYHYKIKHIHTGKYYIGSQYGKKSNKNNFFVSYFTSSKTVKKIISKEGVAAFQIIYLIEREDAREYESRLLKRLYEKFGKDKFLQIMFNRNISPGILLDQDSINRQKETKRKLLEQGKIKKPIPPNWKGKTRSDKMRKKLSLSKMGHEVSTETRSKLREANLGKTQSTETKEKRAETLSRNPNAYGKKHWLFVSPSLKYYYTKGNRNIRLEELGLKLGAGFANYVNSGKSPSQGKNVGWKFYEGESNILMLLSKIDKKDITYYE